MVWKITQQRIFAKRSLDMLDTAGVFLLRDSEFVTIEDTSDPKYKRATTSDGITLYVPSSALSQSN